MLAATLFFSLLMYTGLETPGVPWALEYVFRMHSFWFWPTVLVYCLHTLTKTMTQTSTTNQTSEYYCSLASKYSYPAWPVKEVEPEVQKPHFENGLLKQRWEEGKEQVASLIDCRSRNLDESPSFERFKEVDLET